MKQRIQEMIDKINFNINEANEYYKRIDGRRDELFNQLMNRIYGMVDMMKILTGNEFTVTEDGLFDNTAGALADCGNFFYE